jgi:thiol-disulfide isomerase/thioredoxin
MTRRHVLQKAAAVALPSLQLANAVESGEPMPRFRAKSIDGKSFDNENTREKVLLIQLWTTWCGYCRREQPAVDKLVREFADQGLVVLAVNVGEPKKKVDHYLSGNPREGNVILMQDTNLAALFPTQTFPKYVLVARTGKIRGHQDGAGGIAALRGLLSSAGLHSRNE